MLSKLFLLSLYLGYSKGATLWSWSHESHSKDIHSVLRDGFDYHDTKGQFGIGSDDSLSLEPSPSNDGTYVLRVLYMNGTYSHHGLPGNCRRGKKCYRGAQFYAQPIGLSGQIHTTLTLEYDVWFDDSFQWNKGGKLPGLWGGTRDCSGGNIRDTCFSTRLMWRSEGEGEVYAYVTRTQEPSWDQFCRDNDNLSSSEKYKQISCNPPWGIQIGTGSFKFRHNHWHKIRQKVHLNSEPTRPGYIKLWVDDDLEVHVTNIIMRHRNMFGIDGLFFSTFYGGGDSSWACPHDTYTYYRNFRISTDQPLPIVSLSAKVPLRKGSMSDHVSL